MNHRDPSKGRPSELEPPSKALGELQWGRNPRPWGTGMGPHSGAATQGIGVAALGPTSEDNPRLWSGSSWVTTWALWDGLVATHRPNPGVWGCHLGPCDAAIGSQFISLEWQRWATPGLWGGSPKVATSSWVAFSCVVGFFVLLVRTWLICVSLTWATLRIMLFPRE